MDKHQFSARRRIWGGTMRGLMALCAAVTCALAVFLIVYVLVKGVPNLSWQLLSTKPSYLDGSIGILPDIITTVCTVLTTLLVVLPLGVCAAVYLTEYAANKRVVAVIEYAAEYEDASLALGATETETWFKVSVPAARSGIAAAVVLGVGRAIGEAMAVMMVSGNVPNMPSLFQSVRFLTTAVASEMGYAAAGLQRQALFSIALVLFLFIMLINAALNFFLKRSKEK